MLIWLRFVIVAALFTLSGWNDNKPEDDTYFRSIDITVLEQELIDQLAIDGILAKNPVRLDVARSHFLGLSSVEAHARVKLGIIGISISIVHAHK